MNRRPIPWGEILSRYPGNTVAERFTAMRRGRKYKDIASEIQCTVSAVKSFAQEKGCLDELPGRKKYEYFVTRWERPNYSVMFETLIDQLSGEVALSPEGFKKWIATKAGGEFFKQRCFELKFPIFICNYKARREKCLKKS